MIFPPCSITPAALRADLVGETPGAVTWKVGHMSHLGGDVALSWCPAKGWGFRPKRGLLELKGCACHGMTQHRVSVWVSV